jgi:hypothetical protein
MSLRVFLLGTLALGVIALPQDFAKKEIPAKGDNGQVGGIFGLSPGTPRPSQYSTTPTSNPPRYTSTDNLNRSNQRHTRNETWSSYAKREDPK